MDNQLVSFTELTAEIEMRSFSVSQRISNLIAHLIGPSPEASSQGEACEGIHSNLLRSIVNIKGSEFELDRLEQIIGNKIIGIKSSEPLTGSQNLKITSKR